MELACSKSSRWIFVFPWRKLRSQPLARVQPIARVRHLDRVLARRIGDLKHFLGQQISALFSRARVHVGKVLALVCNAPKAALAEARMTSGASATSSPAYLRVLPASVPQRVSIRTFRPSVQPTS